MSRDLIRGAIIETAVIAIVIGFLVGAFVTWCYKYSASLGS